MTAVGERVLATLSSEETGFKQLVSFNVKLLLHEPTAFILDMKVTRCVHLVSSDYNGFFGAHCGTMVEALRYKPEGRKIDSRWSLEFFNDIILPVALWPWGRLSLYQK
jgi:hypothetical protein